MTGRYCNRQLKYSLVIDLLSLVVDQSLAILSDQSLVVLLDSKDIDLVNAAV
jgi:hypothetical protein